MNTFWLKLAVLVVVAVILIVLVSVFSSNKSDTEKLHDRQSQAEKKPKTFYDVAEMDEKRLEADPIPKGWKPAYPGEEPPTPEFRELDQIQQIQADRLWQLAKQHRKIGRLPGPSFKQAVDYSRRIIETFPDTIYSFKARRLLGSLREKYRVMYGITDEEIDLGQWE